MYLMYNFHFTMQSVFALVFFATLYKFKQHKQNETDHASEEGDARNDGADQASKEGKIIL